MSGGEESGSAEIETLWGYPWGEKLLECACTAKVRLAWYLRGVLLLGSEDGRFSSFIIIIDDERYPDVSQVLCISHIS